MSDGAGDFAANEALASALFGDRLPLVARFAQFLADAGTVRGLIGPREVPRLWERHVLNCAVVSELLPVDARVVDVGTGAGLPGLVLACRRPDLRVDLVESLQRRVDFLSEAVELLGLSGSVRVVRGRAEDSAVVSVVGNAKWVTARAVAPLDRLVKWCVPLLVPGGSLLAMKGDAAEQELSEQRASIIRAGGTDARIVECGVDVMTPPVRVVIVDRKMRRPKKEHG